MHRGERASNRHLRTGKGTKHHAPLLILIFRYSIYNITVVMSHVAFICCFVKLAHFSELLTYEGFLFRPAAALVCYLTTTSARMVLIFVVAYDPNSYLERCLYP